jgi:hypothetical protein
MHHRSEGTVDEQHGRARTIEVEEGINHLVERVHVNAAVEALYIAEGLERGRHRAIAVMAKRKRWPPSKDECADQCKGAVSVYVLVEGPEPYEYVASDVGHELGWHILAEQVGAARADAAGID